MVHCLAAVRLLSHQMECLMAVEMQWALQKEMWMALLRQLVLLKE